MALGVLNNLSAIYAENNLNNTNNSLQTVLEQLSSGSRINSGADDAAGLSLVNGLEANQTALTQSETNATEGVGMLQVADGALSQVTSLLDRAITLATEASNGTLNSTQEAAADQEYQTILSEINNIGQTTTYNQQQVFTGQQVSIYTGDSSAAGSSIDELNIRNLSESSMGDTGGKMAYSDGSSNVFLNLSTATDNAQVTDTLNTSGATTVNVTYLVKGANGTESSATTSISVGTGTSFANTASGLISAINAAGLGLTATFATQTQAGVTGGGNQTGIEITGGLVSVGVDPSRESTSGVLNPSGIPADELLTQGQTVTVNAGSSVAASITVNSSTSTLTELANAINSGVGGTAGLVTATVVTNGDGTQSLSLSDATSSGGALTVTTGGTNYSSNTLTDGSASVAPVTLAVNGSSTGAAGSDATATLGISGTNSSSDALTGSIVLSNDLTPGANPLTFVMGAGTDGGGTIYTGNYGNGGSTLGNLAIAIQDNLNVSAAVTAAGIDLTSTDPGTTIEQVGASALMATPAMTVTDNVAGATATPGTDGTTTLSMNGGNGFASGDTLAAGTSIVLANGTVAAPGTEVTFVMGGVTSGDTIGVAGGQVSDLLTAITSAQANTDGLGISAAAINGSGQIVLTSTSIGTTITMDGSSNLADTPALSATLTAAQAANPGSSSAGATLLTGVSNGVGGITQAGDALTGSITITNGSVTDVFTIGGVSSNGTVAVTSGDTLTDLENAINATSALGVTATLTSNGSDSGLSLTTADLGTTIDVTGANTLQDNYGMNFTNPASGAPPQYQSGVLDLTDGGVMPGAGNLLSGTLTITSNPGGAGPIVTDTFVMGQAADSVAGNTWNLSTANSNIAGLVAAIEGTGGFAGNGAGTTLDLNASVDGASGGLFVQALSTSDTGLTANTSGLTDIVDEAGTDGSAGHAVTAATPAQVVYSNGGTNAGTDTVTGAITLSNSGHGGPTVFTMGGNGGTTLNSLAAAITADSSLDLTATAGASGLIITSNDLASTLSNAGSLTDAYGALATTVAGAPPTLATNAFTTIGTSGTIGTGDTITGSIVLTNNGGPGGTQTFTMGTGPGDVGTTIGELAAAISASTLGLTASVNAMTGALQLQANSSDTSIVVDGSSDLADTVTETVLAGSPDPGAPASASVATFTLASGNIALSDTITGGLSITANGNTVSFTMGATATQAASSTSSNVYIDGTTLADLEAAINASTGASGLNVTAGQSGSNLTLTSNVDNATPIAVSGNTLNDAFGNPASTASLGTYANSSDLVTGSISFNLGGSNPESITIAPGSTVAEMVNQINGANGDDPYGVTATMIPTGHGNFVTVQLTSDTYGPTGQIEDTSGSSVIDTTATASLSYTAGRAYSTGLSGGSIGSGTAIYDSSTGQTDTSNGEATMVSNTNGLTGVATISYSDGAGEDLGSTDLLNQTDAQTALNDLNLAISDVAAQDGYIGAQINTLNSISQVMSTQQENVVSAQNALQATDYASATSNMSKYEILSQTGIAALAQANSVQQEVTKLLQ